ncbi:MAG: alpha/beta hydrolase [Haliscomenobacteraceae bacterium CHB4]|nr:2-hydroxy-6-oxononadienedioate/2-hydroxy-6-oxononatrienedioate hydrolase [Saprospiraceae bacterium]MCE7925425.1 alpha/beta hydrolase [Haliscomenobacteraceae bacterium CHB4]
MPMDENVRDPDSFGYQKPIESDTDRDERSGGDDDRLETARKWVGHLSISRLLRGAVLLSILIWIYRNWHEDIRPQELLQQYTYPDSRFLRLDGMDVHCRITGKGEPVLLLHNAQSSLHTWAGWTEQLSHKYQVISVDLPGFGLTGPHPRGSYSAFMYAGFLDSLVARLDLKKFHLAGNGLGAEIAWFYAADHPERLQKLILLDAPGFEPKTTPWIIWIARTPVLNQVMTKITPRSFLKIMLEEVFADHALVTDSLVQRHFELLLRSGNRQAFIDRASVSENRPPVDIIERINIPTLILWGAEDARLSPEFAYDFHRNIRGSYLRIYRNTGHWPQEENAEQTVKDVMAFLEGKF